MMFQLRNRKRLLCTFLLCGCAARADVRIVSLNIAKKHGSGLLQAIGNQPDLRKADVLMLQEVVDSPRDHVANEIASALDLHVALATAVQLNPELAEGLAVLSRYPIVATDVIRLPINDLHLGTTWRIALAATIESPIGRMQVINLHLDDRLNDPSERGQLAPVWEEASRFTGPCVIGGDFNTSNMLWTAHLVPLPGLQNQTAVVRREMAKRGFTTPLGSGGATFHFAGLKLDWIYLRDLGVVGSGVTRIRFSDHNSVWVTVRGP